MKTPIQQLIEEFSSKSSEPYTEEEIKEKLKSKLIEEKAFAVRAFNNGMRDTNDNGYDYYNEWYNESV